MTGKRISFRLSGSGWRNPIGQPLFGTRAGAPLPGRVHPFLLPPTWVFDPGSRADKKTRCEKKVCHYIPLTPHHFIHGKQSVYHTLPNFSQTGIRDLVRPHHALHTTIPQSFEQHITFIELYGTQRRLAEVSTKATRPFPRRPASPTHRHLCAPNPQFLLGHTSPPRLRIPMDTKEPPQAKARCPPARRGPHVHRPHWMRGAHTLQQHPQPTLCASRRWDVRNRVSPIRHSW